MRPCGLALRLGPAQQGVEVGSVGVVLSGGGQAGRGNKRGVLGSVNGVAVAVGTSTPTPVEQIVARLDCQPGFPGDNPGSQARIVEETPLRPGEQAARRNPLREGTQQREAVVRAGDVVQHAEQDDQIELAERGVRRLFEQIARLQAGVAAGERGASAIQQRGAAVEADVAQSVFAEAFRQKDAEAPVAAAGIQHGQRGAQVRQQALPADPGLLAAGVEVGGGGRVEAPVQLIEIANSRGVHNFPYNVLDPDSHPQGLYSMRTTLKKIDVGSAFRVGFVVYALLFAVFGLLFVALQGLLLSGMAGLARNSVSGGTGMSGGDLSVFFGAGVLGLLCFYGVGIVAAAVGGGIQFALGAFCYNLAARWIGGVQIELERTATTSERDLLDDIERDAGKPKRDEL